MNGPQKRIAPARLGDLEACALNVVVNRPPGEPLLVGRVRESHRLVLGRPLRVRSLEAAQPTGDPAGPQATVETVDSGAVPEQVLQLEEAVPVRRRHEELSARLQLLVDHGQGVAQLLVVQVLEDL